MSLLMFVFIGMVVFLRSTVSNFSLYFTLRWLKCMYRNPRKATAHRFIVIIPALREQAVLEETINYFLRVNYPTDRIMLLVVTTERETAETSFFPARTLTTPQLVAKLKMVINPPNGLLLEHLHYPDPCGIMVDQVNYAFKYIIERFPDNRSKIFAAIYNADSRPNLDTFQVVSGVALQNNGRVFQQSALFFENIHRVVETNHFPVSRILQANSVLQSRWTLVHEISRFIRQSWFLSRLGLRLFLAHTVGHGLFLRLDLIDEIQCMPTGTLTEDLFFGYLLSLLGEPIRPLPVMESSESPDTMVKALKQKYIWFFGPLDHLEYSRRLRDYGFSFSPIITCWFALQGLLPAAAWLAQGWFLFYLFLYPLVFSKPQLLFISSFLALFYGPLSWYLILRQYKELSRYMSRDDHLKRRDVWWILALSPIAIFLHSIPPIFSLLAKFRQIIYGKLPPKPKTER